MNFQPALNDSLVPCDFCDQAEALKATKRRTEMNELNFVIDMDLVPEIYQKNLNPGHININSEQINIDLNSFSF
jgi:hypothetical protein